LATEEKKPAKVTATGAGKILNWTRARVNIYIRRGNFPAPYETLNEGLEGTQQKVWLRKDIEDFKAEREGKRRGKEEHDGPLT
jgi:hypothetical protein